MSFHHEALGEGRRMLRDNAGRTAAYVPPATAGGAALTGIAVRYTAAEDVPVDPIEPGELRRVLTLFVEIGAGPGQLRQVHRGGQFLIDVEGSGTATAWTVESFPHADDGWRRCLCVQQILRANQPGQLRPNRP